jgi:argininosuccinate lyase
VSCAAVGRPIEYAPAKLDEILSPQHFVRVRTTPGGPAPSETGRAIATSRDVLGKDEAWLNDTVARLRLAESSLAAAVAAL